MKHTREKIISAARDLFEKNGFTATTTREIAVLAGVSEVTVFRHFETKRNLFEQTVHSCIHPYKLQTYLDNEATYDLEKDLTIIAYNMMETYQQNLPLLKMIFKDKMGETMSKIHLKDEEHSAKRSLHAYFETMKRLGKTTADPRMAIKFFMTNISGFFLKAAFSMEQPEKDEEYFSWMIQRIIVALQSE